MTKALPCINIQQKAAKIISKDQQTLRITDLVQNKTKCKLLGAVYLFLLKSKLNSVVFAYNSIFIIK